MNKTKHQATIKKQGKDGELAFRDWLIKFNAPFFYIDQNIENYASIFENKIKRPDFLLLLQGMGLIAVGVKHLSHSESGGFTLTLEKELAYSVEFEHQFKMYLWYAIKPKNCDKGEWYFISAYSVLEHGKLKTNQKTNTRYFDIPLKHFVVLKDPNKIFKLFKKRIGFVGTLTRLTEDYFNKSKISI